jgi:hypothetical protein
LWNMYSIVSLRCLLLIHWILQLAATEYLLFWVYVSIF